MPNRSRFSARGVVCEARVGKTSSLNDRVIEAGWLILAAGLPLLIAPWGRNLFELPKALLVWTVAAVMGAAWLTRREKGEQHAWQMSTNLHRAFGMAVLAFGVVLVLSASLSVNPLQSMQGSYDRMQGIITTLCILALFLIIADRLRDTAQVHRLLTTIAWGSAPVVIYGLLQAVGLDPLHWQAEGSPALSTLGRSNFLGAYLVISQPLTLACALLASHSARRASYIALMAAQLMCLLATMTRAAWLGALAAGGVFALSVAWSRGHHRLTVIASIVSILGLAAGLIALACVPGLTGSIGARVTIWRATWSLVAVRPILGYGPETLAQTFSTVFPAELVYLQGRAVIVDRAHNLILDTLASGGLAGLLAYAATVGMVIASALQAFVKSQDHQMRIVLAAGLAAAVGHLVETQLSFPVTTTATMFWLTLGMLVAPWIQSPALGVFRNSVCRLQPAELKENQPYGSYKLLALLLLVVLMSSSLILLVADAHAGLANHTRTTTEVQHSIAAMERAITLWPTQAAYHEHLSWLHLQLARRGYNSPVEFRSAEAALDAARRLAPGNYRTWAGYGELYTEWGKAGDPSRFAQAERAYGQATTLFPESAMLHTGWGLSYMAQNRIAQAADQFHQAAGLDHTDAWAHWYLGDAQLALDDLDGAEQSYRNALRWAPDLAGPYRGLGHIYRRQGQIEPALLAYQNALNLAPGDPNLYLDMARCHRELGQYELACQTVEHGLWIVPDHPGLLSLRAGCK